MCERELLTREDGGVRRVVCGHHGVAGRPRYAWELREIRGEDSMFLAQFATLHLRGLLWRRGTLGGALCFKISHGNVRRLSWRDVVNSHCFLFGAPTHHKRFLRDI